MDWGFLLFWLMFFLVGFLCAAIRHKLQGDVTTFDDLVGWVCFWWILLPMLIVVWIDRNNNIDYKKIMDFVTFKERR